MNRTEHREGQIFPYVEYSFGDKNKKRPLIIQLHGAGERGCGKEDLEKVDVHGFSKFLQDAEYECTVVMPQCPLDSFWAAKVESIIKFVEQMIGKYNADPNKVYLTGLSMGGYGTWYTAMARPDLFAAIAPVCGGGMAWNAYVLKNLPIWTFHGVEDTTVSVVQTDEMVEQLKKHGADVKYTRMDNVEHNVWEYAYNKELMKWLLSKEKQKL